MNNQNETLALAAGRRFLWTKDDFEIHKKYFLSLLNSKNVDCALKHGKYLISKEEGKKSFLYLRYAEALYLDNQIERSRRYFEKGIQSAQSNYGEEEALFDYGKMEYQIQNMKGV